MVIAYIVFSCIGYLVVQKGQKLSLFSLNSVFQTGHSFGRTWDGGMFICAEITLRLNVPKRVVHF